MTRWARAGSSQKHKKVPGDATKWGEFDVLKEGRNLSKQKVKKKEVNIDNKKVTVAETDFSLGKITDSSKKNKLPKDNISPITKNIKKIKSEPKDDCSKMAVNSISDDTSVITQHETKSLKNSSLAHNVKNKFKNKKRKGFKQNDKSGKNSELSSVKGFEKKKNTYLEKLKKKRAENGILLLPSKIERKLYNIKRRLREKNLPVSLIKEIIRKERRKEELKFRKTFNPSKLCFNCRQAGHVLADCPEKLGSSNQETGICFKCGSLEHTSFKCPEKVQGFPFAKCFICKESGHISRDCPRNKHGVYPKGGRCNLCGNVNHLKKDCPTLSKTRENESSITLQTMNNNSSIEAEVLESRPIKKEKARKPKIVKF